MPMGNVEYVFEKKPKKRIRTEYMKNYYQKNREQILAQKKEYYKIKKLNKNRV
jgi:hypothetical protein